VVYCNYKLLCTCTCTCACTSNKTHKDIGLCISSFRRLKVYNRDVKNTVSTGPYVLVHQAQDITLDLLMDSHTFCLMFVLKFWWYIKTSFTLHVAIDFFVGFSWLLSRIVTFYGEITIDVDKLLLKLLNTVCHILDKQLLAVCFMIAAHCHAQSTLV